MLNVQKLEEQRMARMVDEALSEKPEEKKDEQEDDDLYSVTNFSI
jgi:hypothetical protein